MSKKIVSLILVICLVFGMAAPAAAEESQKSLKFPVFTDGEGYAGSFLLNDDKLYISTDTLEFIGKSRDLTYIEIVLGEADRALTRKADSGKNLTCYLYEGDYIDTDEGTFVLYSKAMKELCISTYMGSGQSLVAEPANDVRYLQNRLSSIRSNKNYGMSSFRDEKLLGLVDSADAAHLSYLFFHTGKNLTYISTLLGITSTELYQKAFMEIMVPTAESDYQFHAESVNFVNTLAEADGALDDVFNEEVLRKLGSNETLTDILGESFKDVAKDVKNYHHGLVGWVEKLGMAMDFVQAEDLVARAVFLDNIDKVEVDVVSALENLFSYSDGLSNTYLQVALAIELENFQKGSFSSAVMSELPQGAIALGDSLLFESFDRNSASAKYSKAISSFAAAAISTAGDIFFDTQDKIDATLMVTTNLNISEVARGAMGAICNRYWDLEWGEGKGEMLEDMRNMAVVYLRACKNAWKYSTTAESDPSVAAMMEDIDSEIAYITSFSDRDFLLVRDAGTTEERLISIAGRDVSGSTLFIGWDAAREADFGTVELNLACESELILPDESGSAYIGAESGTVYAEAERGSGYITLNIMSPCRIEVSDILSNIVNLECVIYFADPSGTASYIDPAAYLFPAPTGIWYYGIRVSENGVPIPEA